MGKQEIEIKVNPNTHKWLVGEWQLYNIWLKDKIK